IKGEGVSRPNAIARVLPRETPSGGGSHSVALGASFLTPPRCRAGIVACSHLNKIENNAEVKRPAGDEFQS
ncbi:MAG TPA: hypothetical protein VIM52_09150, partial [Stellaceae bacterium]